MTTDPHPKQRKRWFVALYPEEGEIKACLNAMIYFSRPEEKDIAHVTIRGPFSAQVRTGSMEQHLVGSTISVVGSGHFFGPRQSTVILKCGADRLRRFWKKGDYSYNPHLTIYDGKSREFAERLFGVLSKHKLFFSFVVGECRTIYSIPGERTTKLRESLDESRISKLIDRAANLDAVRDMSEAKRLEVIERLCARVEELARARTEAETPKGWQPSGRKTLIAS